MVEEEQKQEQVIDIKEPKTKKSAEKALKIFSIILGLLSIVALIWIKIVNPEFPLLYVIILLVFIILISGSIFFGFSIFRKLQEKPTREYQGDLPRPASLLTLRKMVEESMTNEYFCNHVNGCKNERYAHAGKYNERIYVYETKALYSDEMEKGNIFILINTHYPEDLKTILIDPTSYQVQQSINNLASVSEDVPDLETETRKTYNPLTSAYEEVEKKHTKKQLKKLKEDKEDLE